MAVTERVTVLMEPSQKAEIATRARAAGMSVGEYLRAASENFTPEPDEGLSLERLQQVLGQLADMYRENHENIAETARFIEQSEARMRAAREGQ